MRERDLGPKGSGRKGPSRSCRKARIPPVSRASSKANGKTHATYSLIHGDQLHVIDFDDAGFGWHPYELAVALFFYWPRPSFEATHEALTRGYSTVRAFDDAAVELVPLFILVRALALLGWRHERPELDHGDAISKLIELVCAEATAWGLA